MITKIDSNIKVYPNNIEIWFEDNGERLSQSIVRDNFLNFDFSPICESEAREQLSEIYSICGDAQDMIIDEMYIFEWISED